MESVHFVLCPEGGNTYQPGVDPELVEGATPGIGIIFRIAPSRGATLFSAQTHFCDKPSPQ
jgi:hypothetical protein